jgi:hypothetical protein
MMDTARGPEDTSLPIRIFVLNISKVSINPHNRTCPLFIRLPPVPHLQSAWTRYSCVTPRSCKPGCNFKLPVNPRLHVTNALPAASVGMHHALLPPLSHSGAAQCKTACFRPRHFSIYPKGWWGVRCLLRPASPRIPTDNVAPLVVLEGQQLA